MAKDINIQVEADHLESLTRTSGVGALMELIWNALDADSTNISVFFEKDALGNITEIRIEDNGHAISYGDAERIFSTLGGSVKKNKVSSPGNRLYHGKEGKGRYKALALGHLVLFRSVYHVNETLSAFSIKLDMNNLKRAHVSDLEERIANESAGFKVIIHNVNQKAVQSLPFNDVISDFEKMFAVYHSAYPSFQVEIDGRKLSFESQIKYTREKDFIVTEGCPQPIDFHFKIIEWISDCDRKLFCCNSKGISYSQDNLGVRTRLPLSVYIMSDHVEQLRLLNLIELWNTDPIMKEAVEEAKDFTREYVRNRLHENARDFIDELKKEEIYPYTVPVDPADGLEVAKRQVFDIVALNVNEFMPSFLDQDKQGKKLTMTLLKEALENNTSGLQRVLQEVIRLPEDRIEELCEILDRTSLEAMIDTMSEVTDRLRTIYELRQLLFDDKYRHKVKERRHLHKILINETWLFGDDYSLGAQDVNLKNVLRAHLRFIGREDFEEAAQSGDNNELKDIPDICLFKQYNQGEQGRYKHLIIEIKKPTLVIGSKEIQQIRDYAKAVSNDQRFEKDKTKWVFVLLATGLDEDADFQCKSDKEGEYGHIHKSDGLDIFVMKWNRLLGEAEARHQYLKEKLNYTIRENDEGIILLKKKYQQYLPDDIESCNTSEKDAKK